MDSLLEPELTAKTIGGARLGRGPDGLARPAAIVTTSWDDGHRSDLRLAELLGRHGMRGTFYVPSEAVQRPALTPDDLRALDGSDIEIGAHTVSHVNLARTNSERARRELRGGKEHLEQILGRSVGAFCYPFGKFHRNARRWVEEAGYELARTTRCFRTESGFDPLLMPVTFQFFPHSRFNNTKICTLQRNARGFRRWTVNWGWAEGLERLTVRALETIEREGGALHIWGHSWELDRHRLWELLETVCRTIEGRPGVQYLTNSQTLAAIEAEQRVGAGPRESGPAGPRQGVKATSV